MSDSSDPGRTEAEAPAGVLSGRPSLDSPRGRVGGRRIRCAHYLPGIHLREGGIVRAVLDWCSALSARGLEVTLLAGGRADGPDPPDIPAEWLDPAPAHAGQPGRPRAVLVPPPSARFGAAGMGAALGADALRIASEVLDRVDVLHLHAPWLPGNRQLARLARRRGVPYIVTPHGMLDDWSMSQRGLKKRLYLRLFGRRFLEGAAAVHCTADAERAQARKWFSRPPAVVLPLPFDLGPFLNLPGPEPARRAFPPMSRPGARILYLGRLHEKKGVDLLIRAAAAMKRAARSFVLLIAGSGEADYQNFLRQLARDLEVGDSVEFLGHVGGVERISLLQSADVLALPTHQENFGLVLTEALACGTPVVTTRGVDIWREIQSAGGVIVDRSSEALVGGLEQILSDPAARSLGERGRRWVLEHLDPGRVGADYERLYAEVAGITPAEPGAAGAS